MLGFVQSTIVLECTGRSQLLDGARWAGDGPSGWGSGLGRRDGDSQW